MVRTYAWPGGRRTLPNLLGTFASRNRLRNVRGDKVLSVPLRDGRQGKGPFCLCWLSAWNSQARSFTVVSPSKWVGCRLTPQACARWPARTWSLLGLSGSGWTVFLPSTTKRAECSVGSKSRGIHLTPYSSSLGLAKAGHSILPSACAEGFTFRWEYSGAIPQRALLAGANLVEVVLEDHGGLTAFDMQITGNARVPDGGATLSLLGIAFGGLAFAARRRTS